MPGQIQGTGHPPHPDRRAMVFVDGTNLLCRVADTLGLRIPAEDPPREVLTLATFLLDQALRRQSGYTRLDIIRQYWFGSHLDELVGDRVKEQLRLEGFEAHLIRQKPAAV